MFADGSAKIPVVMIIDGLSMNPEAFVNTHYISESGKYDIALDGLDPPIVSNPRSITHLSNPTLRVTTLQP